jgi:6-phosphogluconolactonase
MKTEILPSHSLLIARCLELVLDKIHAAIDNQGYCAIALAGGNTPKPLYEALAEQNLPWEKIYIFWGDERYVPSDHPDSNYRMANLAWLSKVPIPQNNIYPIPTDEVDPYVAASKYEQTLKQVLKTEGNKIPALDVILLGMGDDGHTASLFPHTEALTVRDRLVTVGNKDGQPRITLTVPMINQANFVIFIATGANKRPALAQVFALSGDDLAYPSRLIKPQGQLWWLLDQCAGGE